jgi:SAM-dependent methyltransferase
MAGKSGRERAELLNDLGVLRHAARDTVGAVALLEASLAIDPGHSVARENLESLAQENSSATAESVDAKRPTGAAALNPWVVNSLYAADAAVGLAGSDVVEVGGSIPVQMARQLGVKSWTACDLRPDEVVEDAYRAIPCDARALPLPDNSFDAAFSVCAFEHFQGVDAVLSELHRVLRPGARLFTQFAPIWSSANGHHIWIREDDRTSLTFNDAVLPPWGHLLLDEHEIRAFLTLTRGARLAHQAVEHIVRGQYVNRHTEGDFRRFVEASPFEIESYECWGGEEVPSPMLEAELRRRTSNAGELAVHGLQWVLRKRPASAG